MTEGNVNSRHALIFVVITVALDMIGFGIIMPVLPELLMEISGEPLSGASRWGGWLMFSYALLQFVAAPLLGNLSDRFGRRPVLLLSLATYAVNYLIMGFATSLVMLFVGRVLTGIGGGTYSAANALIADVSKPEERAQNFGLTGMALGVGFILGPVIGGLLGEFGPRVPFFAAGGIAVVNLIYGYLLVPETLPKPARRVFDWRRANPVGALAHMQKFPLLFALLAAVFVFQIGHHVYPSSWAFYTIEKFDWSEAQIGYSLGFVGVMMAIVQGGLIRVIIPRLGAERAALFGLAASTVACVGIALAQSGLAIYGWCVISGLAGLAMPAIQGVMANQIPQNEQGELQGAIGCVGSIAAIIGPLLMTQSFAYYTSDAASVYLPGAPFLIAAALSALAGAMFAAGVRSARLRADQA